MKLRHVPVTVNSLMVFVFFSLLLIPSTVWCGLLRINMNDGNSVEVPYFWEESGEVKFEFADGVAGIPKGQVSSIQEILTAKEFDPEVLLDTPRDTANMEHAKKVQDLVAGHLPSLFAHEKLDLEQIAANTPVREPHQKGCGASNEALFGPSFNLENDSAELVRVRGDGVLLVMRNILSSRADLRNRAFTLVAYDGEGNVLQRRRAK